MVVCTGHFYGWTHRTPQKITSKCSRSCPVCAVFTGDEQAEEAGLLTCECCWSSHHLPTADLPRSHPPRYEAVSEPRRTVATLLPRPLVRLCSAAMSGLCSAAMSGRPECTFVLLESTVVDEANIDSLRRGPSHWSTKQTTASLRRHDTSSGHSDDL